MCGFLFFKLEPERALAGIIPEETSWETVRRIVVGTLCKDKVAVNLEIIDNGRVTFSVKLYPLKFVAIKLPRTRKLMINNAFRKSHNFILAVNIFQHKTGLYFTKDP